MDSETANWVFDGAAAVLTVTSLVVAIMFARSSAKSAREAREAVRHAANAADDAWQRVYAMQELSSELKAEIRALRAEIAVRPKLPEQRRQ